MGKLQNTKSYMQNPTAYSQVTKPAFPDRFFFYLDINQRKEHLMLILFQGAVRKFHINYYIKNATCCIKSKIRTRFCSFNIALHCQQVWENWTKRRHYICKGNWWKFCAENKTKNDLAWFWQCLSSASASLIILSHFALNGNMFWAKVFFDHNLPPPQVLPVVHINMSFFREHFTLNRLLILPRLQANYKFNKKYIS